LLFEKLKNEEKIGVTVSGGKDSMYVWQRLVSKFGPERVIAFNHHKINAVHSIATKNLKDAQKILKSELVIIEDSDFFERFKKNLKTYIKTPNPAILRAVICAGCRYGISNGIFKEAKKYNVKKIVNGASYLELEPFKGHYMEKLGNGSEEKGLLLGLTENKEYLSKSNLEIIIKDHFNCHEKNLSNKINSSDIEYINFFDYVENNPRLIKKEVVENLNWSHPVGVTWRFDCLVEDFKQFFYLNEYGYSELDFKYSEMVRYGLISREKSMQTIETQNAKILSDYDRLLKFLHDMNSEKEIIELFENAFSIRKAS